MEKLKYVQLEVVQPKIKNRAAIPAREWIIPYLSSHEVLVLIEQHSLSFINLVVNND